MVGDKGACACTAGDGLQNRCFHFRIAGFVQYGTHGLDDCGALQECFLDAVVHDEIHVALAVAQFRVVERVVGHTVFIFYDRKRLDTLGKHGQLLGMDTDFAHLSAEYKAFDTDEVA